MIDEGLSVISHPYAHLQISVDEIFGVNVLDSTDYLLSKSQTIQSSTGVFIPTVPGLYPVFKRLVTQFHLNIEVFFFRQPLCWTWDQ